jgi:hypothetical protein
MDSPIQNLCQRFVRIDYFRQVMTGVGPRSAVQLSNYRTMSGPGISLAYWLKLQRYQLVGSNVWKGDDDDDDDDGIN